MHSHSHGEEHAHSHASPHEVRTRLAIVLSVIAVLTELIVGRMSGSLALMADGLHLAGDLGALVLSALGFWYARTRARSEHYTFGTGKVASLAGYTNGVLLTLVSISMLVESVQRVFTPEHVQFREALAATVFGLAVSIGKLALVGGHDHAHHHHAHENHNLRALYLHLLSDVITNTLTILALVGIWVGGPTWLDPLVAIFASAIILQWGVRVCRDTAQPLLDASIREHAAAVRERLSALPGVTVRDVRTWSLGEGRHACIAVVSSTVARPVHAYRQAIREATHFEHLAIEVELVAEPDAGAAPTAAVELRHPA